ncbi:hypothetical protein ACFLYU_00650 [Candidatus Dependentiae bacterium]
MVSKTFLLNKNTRNKIFFLDILIFFLLVFGCFFLYLFSPKLHVLIVLAPILLFVLYKLFLFNKRGKALVFNDSKLYGWRSGWVAFKEIKKVHMGKLKGQTCVFFDLNTGWYEPTVYSGWSLYALPSTLVVVCQKDVDEPLELILNEIQKYENRFAK